jgi:hypothetical protein
MVKSEKIMFKTYTRLAIFICLITLVACEKEVDRTGDIKSINYGTSFGECLGYCINQMELNEELAKLRIKGWNELGSLPDIECTRTLGSHEFDNILDSIDLTSFLALDEVIGCPDCADGGAEWLEIRYDTSFHRVTFEYMNEPKAIANVVPIMRELMAGIPGCDEQH